jgi:hypothetical protein
MFSYRSIGLFLFVIFAPMSSLSSEHAEWKRTRLMTDLRGCFGRRCRAPTSWDLTESVCGRRDGPRLGEKWRDVEEDQGSWSIAEHARFFGVRRRETARPVHNVQFARSKPKWDKILGHWDDVIYETYTIFIWLHF